MRIYNSELRHCIIQNNRSDKYGGGIYAYGINSSEKACTIDHCIITRNEAVSGGGGIVNRNAMMRHCEVTHNVATNYSSSGGGVYIENGNSYSVSNCLIANNTAGYGGGIYSGSYTAVVENTTIVRNSHHRNRKDLQQLSCTSYSIVFTLPLKNQLDQYKPTILSIGRELA